MGFGGGERWGGGEIKVGDGGRGGKDNIITKNYELHCFRGKVKLQKTQRLALAVQRNLSSLFQNTKNDLF